MDFVGEVTVSGGARWQDFRVEVGDHVVPGTLWLPEHAEPGPRPLVLAGHGLTLHKRTEYLVALGRWLAGRHGLAVAAIDAIAHGDRLDGGFGEDGLAALFGSREVIDANFTQMIGDWSATLEACRAVPEVGTGPLGYWGLSLGTLYGLPYVASEPDVQVAVFGLMGVLPGPVGERLAKDAAAIDVPVMKLCQWDDDLIHRDTVLDLFDRIATTDKRMHVNPGAHAAIRRDEFLATETFVLEHLAQS